MRTVSRGKTATFNVCANLCAPECLHVSAKNSLTSGAIFVEFWQVTVRAQVVICRNHSFDTRVASINDTSPLILWSYFGITILPEWVKKVIVNGVPHACLFSVRLALSWKLYNCDVPCFENYMNKELLVEGFRVRRTTSQIGITNTLLNSYGQAMLLMQKWLSAFRSLLLIWIGPSKNGRFYGVLVLMELLGCVFRFRSRFRQHVSESRKFTVTLHRHYDIVRDSDEKCKLWGIDRVLKIVCLRLCPFRCKCDKNYAKRTSRYHKSPCLRLQIDVRR